MSAPESIEAYAARLAAEAPPLTADAAALIVGVLQPLVHKNRRRPDSRRRRRLVDGRAA